MIFTDLARGMRSVIAMLAVASLLVACSENPDEAVPESTQPDATTPAANTGETMTSKVAYGSNQKDGVSVIDLSTMEVIDTIDVDAEEPRGIGITNDGKFLITANGGGDISVIDTATREVVKHIEVGKNPEFVRVKDNLVFVSFEPSSTGGPPPKHGEEVEEEE